MKLYEVQKEALRRAEGKRGYGWWMDMGTGKTLTALIEFSELANRNLVDLMIVICPNSLIGTWEDEVKKYDVPFPAYIRQTDGVRIGISLFNYESIIAKAGDEIVKAIKSRRVYLVLDESVAIKNPRAKRTKRLLSVIDKATYVRCLSGAPIVQSAFDAWAQLRAIDAPVNPNPYGFRNKYCVMGGWQGKQVVGIKNKESLNKLMTGYGFIAKKSDWTDLPEQLYTDRNYEMDTKQAAAYKDMYQTFIVQLQEDRFVSVQMAIHQMLKLQQISSGYIIDETGKVQSLVTKNPKVMLAREIIDEIPGKAIIFTAYRHSVSILRNEFRKDGYAYLMGGMTKDEIEEQKDRFNNGDAKVFIAQVASGKYGLTLLGTADMPCHTTIFFENTYSLNDRIQAEARCHRHGQHYPVTHIDLIGTPIDKKIIRALQKKLELASIIMEIGND